MIAPLRKRSLADRTNVLKEAFAKIYVDGPALSLEHRVQILENLVIEILHDLASDRR